MREGGRRPCVQRDRGAHPGTLLGERPRGRRPPGLGGYQNEDTLVLWCTQKKTKTNHEAPFSWTEAEISVTSVTNSGAGWV